MHHTLDKARFLQSYNNKSTRNIKKWSNNKVKIMLLQPMNLNRPSLVILLILSTQMKDNNMTSQ